MLQSFRSLYAAYPYRSCRELLGIEEPQKLAFMVAFGYPAHKAHIVPLTAETGVKYYLDENRDYCVPKRSKEEIARSV